MKVTKWMRKKAMNRLVKVENLNIGRREKKAKRIAMWTLIDILVWTLVVTGLPGETIVIENVFASEPGEKSDAIMSDGSLMADGEQVAEGQSEETVEAKIRRVFSENPDEAVAIARCESQMNPDRIGDLHLPVDIGGETLGYSYGLFQIRSGGKDVGGAWSRPAKAGMSLNEWAKKMLDPDENIKEAKRIYDHGGWGPWTCKKALGNH